MFRRLARLTSVTGLDIVSDVSCNVHPVVFSLQQFQRAFDAKVTRSGIIMMSHEELLLHGLLCWHEQSALMEQFSFPPETPFWVICGGIASSSPRILQAVFDLLSDWICGLQIHNQLSH